MPHVDPLYLMSGGFFAGPDPALLASSSWPGRSPHVVYRPEQIDVRLDDVKGLDPVTEDVRRSLDLFLAGRTFRREMGGTPRRGLLFEGPPGTGKTHLAKAMAAEAGRAVPVRVGDVVPVDVLRRHRPQDPHLLHRAAQGGPGRGRRDRVHRGDRRDRHRRAAALRRRPPRGTGGCRASGVATGCGGPRRRCPGRAAAARGGPAGLGWPVGHTSGRHRRGQRGRRRRRQRTAGADAVVRRPTRLAAGAGRARSTPSTCCCPPHRQLPGRGPSRSTSCSSRRRTGPTRSTRPCCAPAGSTGGWSFDRPDKAGRRELIDHFLARKAHDDELDGDEHRDALAGITQGTRR